MVVAVGNDGQFARLCALLEVVPRPEWATNPDRLQRREEVLGVLAPRIAEWGRDELVAAMVASDVPGGPVHSVREATEAMRSVEPEWISTVGPVQTPASPIRIDGQRLPVRWPPPRLGEHTDEILAEVGVAAEEINRLRAEGIVA